MEMIVMQQAFVFVRNRVEQFPVLSSALVALLLFVVLTAPYSFPFMCDDWDRWAAVGTGDGMDPAFLGNIWARVPVWSALALILFRPAVWSHGWIPMYVCFFVHALGAAWIARWLRRRVIRTSQTTVDSGASAVMEVLLGTAVALFPNHYEIIYWPTCMPYVVGTIFLAGALHASSMTFRWGLLTMAFLNYETFILPALALLILPEVVGWIRSARFSLRQMWGSAHVRSVSLVWAAAVAATVVVRRTIGLWTGNLDKELRLEPSHVAAQLRDMVVNLVSLRVGGTWETATVVHGCVLGVVVWMALRTGVRRGRVWGALLVSGLALVLSTAHYWALSYPASRALYGTFLLEGALIACGVWWVGSLPGRRGQATVLAAALVLIYGGQDLRRHRVKDHNSAQVAAREAELAVRIRECREPCTLALRGLDEGIHSDWVLHPDYWVSFARVVQARTAPDKHISWVIESNQPPPMIPPSAGAGPQGIAE